MHLFLSQYAFLDPSAAYPLPSSFKYREYIETEQELWALFPETDGKRVNFVQIGLTAQIYEDSPERGKKPNHGDSYRFEPTKR